MRSPRPADGFAGCPANDLASLTAITSCSARTHDEPDARRPILPATTATHPTGETPATPIETTGVFAHLTSLASIEARAGQLDAVRTAAQLDLLRQIRTTHPDDALCFEPVLQIAQRSVKLPHR